MERKYRGLYSFFAVVFGLPVVFGILMGIAYGRGQDVSAFPIVWMFLPACGVMWAELGKRRKMQERDGDDSRENGERLPVLFYATFLVTAAGMLFLAVTGVFMPDDRILVIMNYIIIGLSIVSIAEIAFLKKERREAFGLSLSRNWKKGLEGIVLFIVVYLILSALSVVIGYLTGEGMEEMTLNPYLASYVFFVLPLNLVLTFIIFFGEEYGWRYYLQPVLQQRFGRKKGVIILGLLWGIWHLPLNLFYYSPETGLQSVLAQLAGCVGMAVFFGWVYMRTQNIWTVTVIHFLNNNLGMALFNVMPVNVERTWPDTIVTILLYLAVYLPFLYTKEYRGETENIGKENCNES